MHEYPSRKITEQEWSGRWRWTNLAPVSICALGRIRECVSRRLMELSTHGVVGMPVYLRCYGVCITFAKASSTWLLYMRTWPSNILDVLAIIPGSALPEWGNIWRGYNLQSPREGLLACKPLSSVQTASELRTTQLLSQ
jgi:hypothetical protein